MSELAKGLRPFYPDDASPTVKHAVDFLAEISAMLIEKNRAYGDSAALPLRIFSQASAVEGVRVRIDDKLSRLARGKNLEAVAEDTIADLVGYLALLRGLERQDKAAE